MNVKNLSYQVAPEKITKMKSRKICYIVCSIFVFISTSIWSQENKSQELIMSLNNGEFFKSKRLHQQICDTIRPEIELYYKFRMAQFMNKKDSSTIYIEKILTEYPNLFGNETINVYAILFDIYAVDLKNYEKGKYTYERMIQHLKENPYNLDEQELTLWNNGNKGRINYLKQLSKQSQINIKRKIAKEPVKIVGDKKLLFEAKFNGITQKTIFDTGAKWYLLVNRKSAEEMGIKCDISEMKKELINNMEVPIKHFVIDSIEIGNITLFNIPTIIIENDITMHLPDSVKNNHNEKAYIDSIYTNELSFVLGLPLMELIGKFWIDYSNKQIIFPSFNTDVNTLKEPNIFVYNNYLFTHLMLNKRYATSFLDTGADSYFDIDTSFYEKHKDVLPIDILKEKDPYNMIMAHQAWTNIPYEILYKPKIIFNSKQMHPTTKDDIKIYPIRSIWPIECFDGIIGYHFFKRIGKKVLLDLDNMRLEAIK